MMFSDVDLLFTNSLSDDLNQNSVTYVIFIANVPEFTASDRFEQTRSVFNFYMRVCPHAKKKLKVLTSNSKCIIYFNEMFCWKSFLLIFVSLSIHISHICV